MLQKLLMLIESFEGMLLEDKVDFITTNQGDKIWGAYEQDPTPNKLKFNTASEVIKYLADNISEKHLQKIVNWYQQSQILLGDVSNIKTLIDTFEKVKPKLEKKDLNQYKDVDDLRIVMDVGEHVSNKQKEREYVKQLYDNKDIETFYKDGDITVTIPKTKEGAIFLGRGTKWCTSAKEENMFGYYKGSGTLYVINCKNGDKYQFYIAKKTIENEYRDDGDNSVDLNTIVNKHPSLVNAFSTIAFDKGIIELMDTVNNLSEIKKGEVFSNNPYINDFSLGNDFFYWFTLNMSKFDKFGWNLSIAISKFLFQRIDYLTDWKKVIDNPVVINGFDPDVLFDHLIDPLLRDMNDTVGFIETLFKGGTENPVLSLLKKDKKIHTKMIQFIIDKMGDDYNTTEIKSMIRAIKKDKESFDILLSIVSKDKDTYYLINDSLEALGVL